MKLLLPIRLIDRLKRELRRGKSSEIGGVLVGEHVAGDTFRIIDLSVQLSGGTAAHFVRDPALAKSFLDDFFKRTGNAYKRFNYIGEWHTHPSFTPLPSSEDCTTMIDLIHDPAVGVNFAVLVIVRLRRWSGIELSATLFRQDTMLGSVNVEVEYDKPQEKRGALAFIRQLFGYP
jgi:integrative and conjugative element protein (TIGR02256 family)